MFSIEVVPNNTEGQSESPTYVQPTVTGRVEKDSGKG